MNVAGKHEQFSVMGIMGRLYLSLYEFICGKHPHIRPWHFEWLAVKALYRDLRELLPEAHGRVLDVGCGQKPYAAWFNRSNVKDYVGIDVLDGPAVDIVVQGDQPWMLSDRSFDAVICIQVLEHVSDIQHVVAEIRRVLAPGGLFLISVPFVYGIHGQPDDYWRFSEYGMQRLLEDDFTVRHIKREGGIGSSIGILLLHWLNVSFSRSAVLRILRGVCLPIWILVALAVNLLATVVDVADGSGLFYHNIIVAAHKKPLS